MTALEICLILIGIAAIVVSYFISEKVSQERMENAAKDFILSEESKEALKKQTKEAVEDILEDMTGDIAGKAERELEKLSNEKIMAVHDYSDTVLEEINKNHSEVMFLYSMLDDKDKEVKHTVKVIQDTVKTVHQLEEKWAEGERKALEIKEQMERVEQEVQTVQNMQVVQIGQMPQLTQMPQDAKESGIWESQTVMEEPIAETAPIEEAASELQENMQNNNEKILKLHSEGKTNLQIAKELGLGMGEVKLVIDLYKEVQ